LQRSKNPEGNTIEVGAASTAAHGVVQRRTGDVDEEEHLLFVLAALLVPAFGPTMRPSASGLANRTWRREALHRPRDYGGVLSVGFLAAFIPWITLILVKAPILAPGGSLAPLLRFQPARPSGF
jgi:hypothetical protein